MTDDKIVQGAEHEPWRDGYSETQWWAMTTPQRVSVYIAWISRQFQKHNVAVAAKSTKA